MIVIISSLLLFIAYFANLTPYSPYISNILNVYAVIYFMWFIFCFCIYDNNQKFEQHKKQINKHYKYTRGILLICLIPQIIISACLEWWWICASLGVYTLAAYGLYRKILDENNEQLN